MPFENGQHLLMVVTRAIHFGALMLPIGSFTFMLLVAGPVVKGMRESAPEGFSSFCATLSRWNAGSLAIALLSGLAWLGLVAATMSGLPLPEALSGEILGTVLKDTSFGHLWGLRLILTALLFVGMLWLCGVRSWESRKRSLRRLFVPTLSCLILGSVAWVGHAAATGGNHRLLHFFADALHLSAAGLWLGSLPALALLLRRTFHQADRQWLVPARESTSRYSTLGVISVGTLVVTGALNSRLLIPDLHSLVASPYGKLLAVKLGLFGIMVSIAAVNRQRIRPMLSHTDYDDPAGVYRRGVERLHRNALLETAIGVLILLLVGLLTTTPPPIHTMH